MVHDVQCTSILFLEGKGVLDRGRNSLKLSSIKYNRNTINEKVNFNSSSGKKFSSLCT